MSRGAVIEIHVADCIRFDLAGRTEVLMRKFDQGYFEIDGHLLRFVADKGVVRLTQEQYLPNDAKQWATAIVEVEKFTSDQILIKDWLVKHTWLMISPNKSFTDVLDSERSWEARHFAGEYSVVEYRTALKEMGVGRFERAEAFEHARRPMRKVHQTGLFAPVVPSVQPVTLISGDAELSVLAAEMMELDPAWGSF